MRPVDGSTSYQPGDPPADPAQLQRFLREELVKLKAALDALAEGFMPVVYAYPTKLKAGMVRNFDGVTINPGSGAGVYRYNGTAWVFLG